MVDEGVDVAEISDAAAIKVAEQLETKDRIPFSEALELPRRWHDQFDTEVWGGKESFHNSTHVDATERAANLYIRGSSEEADPLNFWSDLEKWNQRHPGATIDSKELADVVGLAFRYHDTGNIMSKVKLEDGRLEPDFLPNYTAGRDVVTGKIAEERSADIAESIVVNSDLDDDKKAKYIPLVRHLIGETTFMPSDPDAPFVTFMRTVDQIGNDLYSTNEERVIGLLNESLGEGKDSDFVPYDYFNFSQGRLPQLLPDEADRKMLEKIWKPLREVDETIPKGKMRMSEYLKSMGK